MSIFKFSFGNDDFMGYLFMQDELTIIVLYSHVYFHVQHAGHV